jgi:hypothetical protein
LREWWPLPGTRFCGRVKGEALRTLGEASLFGRPGREKFWGLCRLALLPLEWAVKPGNEGLVTLTGVCGLRTRGRAKYGCEAAAVSSLDEVSMRRICGRALVCDWGNCCEDDEDEGRRSRPPEAAAAAAAAEEETLLGRGEKEPGARLPGCIVGRDKTAEIESVCSPVSVRVVGMNEIMVRYRCYARGTALERRGRLAGPVAHILRRDKLLAVAESGRDDQWCPAGCPKVLCV